MAKCLQDLISNIEDGGKKPELTIPKQSYSSCNPANLIHLYYLRCYTCLMAGKNYEMDMTTGPILGKLLKYAVPLILSGMLQLLFNAVDIIVVGRFAGSRSLAAVGSTTALINIFTNLFIGVSLGVNVLTAQNYAVKNDAEIKRTVHTAIVSAFIFGLFTMLMGLIFCRRVLQIMGSPEDVIDLSALYLRIYFCGMPFFMLYNFGSAILKAVGDTRRPLIYLAVAGVLNAILNVILVVVFHLDVAGVAIATIFSQCVSCVLVLISLMKADAAYRLIPGELRIYKSNFLRMLSIGIPAGIQSMLVSLSNVLIQSSVNSFGSVVMAGYSAINSLRGFCYIAVNSITQSAMSFIGQNYGAGNYKRIKRITIECTVLTVVFGSGLGCLICLLGRQCIGIYSADEAVIEAALSVLPVTLVTYGICGIMDLLPGCMRGMNYSLIPMLIHIFGVVIFRFFWILTVFPGNHTLNNLFMSYPISWILTSALQAVAFAVCYKRVKQKILHPELVPKHHMGK